MPDIGLREILMVAVAITAAYLLLSVLRLLQIARRKERAAPAVAVERSEPGADEDVIVSIGPRTLELPMHDVSPEVGVPHSGGSAPSAEEPKPKRSWLPRWLRRATESPVLTRMDMAGAWPGESPERFGDHLFRSTMETEVQQLRSEVAGLREELKLVKAARRVSPQYNEAMMLAQRGIDAAGIAEQCGISVGEAELVLALSRNRQEYEDGEDDPRRSTG